MKLSISNIGWDASQDEKVYKLMKKYGFSGLEIAPTRVLSENPYNRLEEAISWSRKLKDEYGFEVPSMQSIWFGRSESLFGTEEERQALIDYTNKATIFAKEIGCKNLVFGCPRNRNVPEGRDGAELDEFFEEIAKYAIDNNTVIGMEANPPIYNTNFVNDTLSALELIDKVDSEGFKLNLDVGTMIHNEEDVNELVGKVNLINHVHISEPFLKVIEHRELHSKLKDVLVNEGYDGYVSIEMGKVESISQIEDVMKYIAEVFNS